MGLLTVKLETDNKTKYLAFRKPNLETYVGRDFIHAQNYVNDVEGTRGANYIALSSHSGAPTEDDKELLGEITTGGLERKVAGVAHTIGSNMSLIMVTFIAKDHFTAVQKAGIFNNKIGGVMMHENSFIPTDLDVGHKLTFQWQAFLG